MPVNEHVQLTALWAYRTRKSPLSSEELDHLYECARCMDALGLCEISRSIEEVRTAKKPRKTRTTKKTASAERNRSLWDDRVLSSALTIQSDGRQAA